MSLGQSAVLLLLLLGARPADPRDDDAFQRIRSTYAKWGITFETSADAGVGKHSLPIPSQFNVGGKLVSNDEAELNAGFAFGGRSTRLNLGGKIKVTGQQTTWDGRISATVGGSEFEGEFSSRKMKVGVEMRKGLTLIGCQIGDDSEGPVSFGLTAMGLKVKVDPAKWFQRAREVGPELGKAIDLKLDLSGKFSMLASGARVGGVLIRFDPDDVAKALCGSRNEEKAVEVEPGNVRLMGAQQARALKAASLSRLLASSAATLDDLTRVTGYALEGDDLLVLGLAEPDCPKISMDCLTVALRAVWKEGSFPFVSLDPDPADTSGPQRVRIGGLPDDAKNSEFVEIMLEADYAMKRIDLGEEDPGIPGFERHYDLVAKDPSPETGMNRSWLAPRKPEVGTIWASAHGNRSVVTFESRVEVLTEREKSTLEGMKGTGEVDRLSEAAARNFTRFYPSLAGRRPVFQKLSAVFDLALLSAILRSKNVAHRLLDRAAARSIATVKIKESYAGIGPRAVAGTLMSMSGGAVTDVEFLGGEFVAGGEFTVDGASWEIARPADHRVSGADATRMSVHVLVEEGLDDLHSQRYDAAHQRFTSALALGPDVGIVKGYRALARMMIDDLKGCSEDLEAALPLIGELRALRGFVRLRHGDREGALRDADESCRLFPHDADSIEWAALTSVLALDWEGAEKKVKQLWAIAPHAPEAYNLTAFLTMLRGLGPDRAAARARAMLQLPAMLLDSMSTGIGSIQNRDYEAGIRELRRCLKLADRPEWRERAKAAWVSERSRMALSVALAGHAQSMAKLDPDRAETLRAESEDLGRELAREHPDWPIASLLAGVREPKQAADTFDRALKAGVAGDPLLEDFAGISGTSRALAFVGLALWFRIKDKESAEARSILDKLIPLLGAGVEVDLFQALREASDDPQPRRALALLRRAHKKLPDRLAADTVTSWCVGYFYQTLVAVEQRQGDPKNSIEAGLKYLRLTDAEQPSLECLNQTLTLRLSILMMMAGDYGKRLREDPRVKQLKRDVSNGTIDVDAIRRTLSQAKSQVVEQARDEGTPFSAAWAHVFMESPERSLREDAAVYAKGLSDDAQRAKAQALLDAWDRELDRRRSDRAARQKSNEEDFSRLIEGAKTQVELLTLNRFFELTEAALARVENQSPDEAADVRKAMEALARKYAPLRSRLSGVSGAAPK
jgi:tetratricopeptide (TPR) repeat protein